MQARVWGLHGGHQKQGARMDAVSCSLSVLTVRCGGQRAELRVVLLCSGGLAAQRMHESIHPRHVRCCIAQGPSGMPTCLPSSPLHHPPVPTTSSCCDAAAVVAVAAPADGVASAPPSACPPSPGCCCCFSAGALPPATDMLRKSAIMSYCRETNEKHG